MMTCLEAHASTFGQFYHEDRHYVIITAPYTFISKDDPPRYTAEAICEQDDMDEEGFRPVYSVCWHVTNQVIIDYSKARLERNYELQHELEMEYEINEDSILDCDWNHPYAVGLTMYKYDVETFSKRYSWD